MTFERNNILTMQGYVPGEQPQQGKVIKLNTNENPYPASNKVAEALSAISVENLRRYPPPTAAQFRQIAASYHGVAESNIIPTNGGDELLRLAITTFAGPGDTVGIAVPSYSLYPVLTEIQGCKLCAIELSDQWGLPDDFAARLNTAGAKLALLVNPHAPTGMLLSTTELIEIAREFNGVLLVDEAYVDFVDPELNYNLVPAIHAVDNLLILRTLSKGYSLAGLRFGYGIASENLANPIMYKTRDSYNTDLVSQRLASAALESVDDARRNWAAIRTDRQKLAHDLQRLGMTCLPSQSNFLLAQASDTATAVRIYEALKLAGILVRYFNEPRLSDKLRITIGTPDENQQLLNALQTIMG
jgi:histidinol-phosphate aminotransferase